MKKTLITAAIAALTLTAQADKNGVEARKGFEYEAEIFNEAYKTLIKYKEVSSTLHTNLGEIKISKLKTRPFKKENHGLMKPRSLEGWLVPIRLPSDERLLWLSFKVEVLDFPKLGSLKPTKEFHVIIDIKLVTPFDDDKKPKAVNGWPWMKVIKLKDRPEPALTGSQRTLISRAIAKQEVKLNKKFTAEEYKEQFEIAKKNLNGQHKVGMTLEEASTVVIRDKK